MTISRFSFPTTIHFGPGARALVAGHLKGEDVRRPLIVTDRGIAPLPLLADFVASLSAFHVGVFSGIWGNPVRSQVREGVAAYKAHDADAVIGLGGGAALDVAKAIALMASHPGDILEYAWDHPEVRPIGRPLPHFIALPTTAGTGSEVGRSAVVSDDTTHVKKIVFSPALLAKCVFADPELTFDLPPSITAATGMDALTHNVESYLSPEYHPLCDGIALEGVRIAARALPVAYREGRNLRARSDMLMSSMMGAIAFQKDLGAVHSCAHALSTVADLHHGLANGIMIDHVMRFNLPAATAKMAELARVAGVPGSGGMSERDAAATFIDWLRGMKADLGIPATLAKLDAKRPVTRADVPALVEVAIHDTCHKTNPRPCSREDFERIFAAALSTPRRSPMLKIGIAACFFHEDSQRAIFKGMTLQYIEQNVAHWLMQRDVLAFMVPSTEGRTRRPGSKATLAAYADELDGLVLMGGSDVCPESYGEKALKPEWSGDRIRDDYEIALLRAFMALSKPVLGLCRGAQLINVGLGGTLYQDIGTQVPRALNHRNWAIYEENCHATSFVPGSGLARLYPGTTLVKTNSIHHQAVKALGRDLVVEAWSEPDRIVEAIRYTGPAYLFAVQWHPEFHAPDDPSFVDDTPILDEFLAAAAQHKAAAYTI